MKIYLLMVSRNRNQEQTAEFAYFDKELADKHCKSWNSLQEEKDRADAKEVGIEYEEWVGAYVDYAFVEQVEIIN